MSELSAKITSWLSVKHQHYSIIRTCEGHMTRSRDMITWVSHRGKTAMWTNVWVTGRGSVVCMVRNFLIFYSFFYDFLKMLLN